VDDKLTGGNKIVIRDWVEKREEGRNLERKREERD